MIDKFPNRDLRGQFRQPPKVITMPMSHNQVVNLLKACIFDRGNNATGVARSRSARIAGVDQQRFARGRNEKRRVPAFDIDDINLQIFRGGKYGATQNQKHHYPLAHWDLLRPAH